MPTSARKRGCSKRARSKVIRSAIGPSLRREIETFVRGLPDCEVRAFTVHEPDGSSHAVVCIRLRGARGA